LVPLLDDGAEDFEEVTQEPLSGIDLVTDFNGAVEVRKCEAASKLIFLDLAGNCHSALFN